MRSSGATAPSRVSQKSTRAPRLAVLFHLTGVEMDRTGRSTPKTFKNSTSTGATAEQDHSHEARPRVGQAFNPYGLFTGIFIPEALVKCQSSSAGAKLAFGRLARYGGQDGHCYPAVSTLATEIG